MAEPHWLMLAAQVTARARFKATNKEGASIAIKIAMMEIVVSSSISVKRRICEGIGPSLKGGIGLTLVW